MCEPAEIDDRALLRAFTREGSEAAFRCLVERHSGWVFAGAFRQLQDAHLAEDATQAVFVLLCQRAKKMKPEQKVSGWLFVTLGYTVKSILRSRRRRQRHEKLAAMEQPVSCAPPPPLANDLDAAVIRLSESDRTAILLRFYQGMDFSAMARTLGVSDETAKKRVTRAVARLRERLGADVSEGSLTTASAFGAPVASAALSAQVSHVALSVAGGAPVPASVGAALKGAVYLMAMTKAKILAAVAIIVLLMGTAGTAVIWVAVASKPSPEIAAATSPSYAKPLSPLEQAYGLRTNELIRVVPPPFVKVREEVYKPWGFIKAPQAMVVFWYGGKARIRGDLEDLDGPGIRGGRFNIQFLASCILRVSSQDIEGDVDPVNTTVPGDFVFDTRASAEQLSRAFAKIISDATGYTVTLTFRWVKRPVIVFRGKWRPSTGKIQAYGDKLDKKMVGNNGPGPVAVLADEIGTLLGKSVNIEATDVPGVPALVDWHINDAGAQPPDSNLVCQHIQEQTGLTWTVETRLVKRLFIERQK
jgi:RNA polymerase sigma factor (sigma-70 family)